MGFSTTSRFARAKKSLGVFLAGTLTSFTITGAFKSNGVLLDEIVGFYGVNYLLGGSVLVFQQALSFFVAGIAGDLGLSGRPLAVLGGVLIGLGFFLNGMFAQHLWQQFIFIGITAIGGGFGYFPFYIAFMEHFEEDFAFFYSLRDLFSYTGIIVLPPILEFLRANYGFHGALLIFAAIMWNCIVFGLFLKEAGNKIESNEHQPDPRNSNHSTFERVEHLTLPMSCRTIASKLLSIFSFLSIRPAMKHKSFLLFVIIHSLVYFNFVIWAIFLVPFGISTGLTPQDAVLLSVAGGAGGVAGKLTVIFTFYYELMNPLTSSCLPAAVGCVGFIGYMFSEYYIVLLISSSICGFFFAFADSGLNSLMPKYLCGRHLRQGTVMAYTYNGIFMQAGGIVAGAILDSTSSFITLFGFLLSVNIILIVLAVVMYVQDEDIANDCNDM